MTPAGLDRHLALADAVGQVFAGLIPGGRAVFGDLTARNEEEKVFKIRKYLLNCLLGSEGQATGCTLLVRRIGRTSRID
jgi:hypothetical protein